MRRVAVAIAAAAAAAAGIVLSGQQAADAGRGATVFSQRCASCHGEGGTGANRGPALAANRRLRALPDGQIENIIRNGTPNGMPAFPLPAEDLAALTAFLRSINASAFDEHPSGDAAAGSRFFFGTGGCANCHIALGRGKAIGPDLSNIGRQLALPELTTALTDPSATIAPGYATVRVRLRDGRSFQGFARNEGNQALPLQTLDGRLISIDKQTATITRETASAMPPLKASAGETRDLIAYLSTLNGERDPGSLSSDTGSSATFASGEFDQILHPKPGDWPTYHGRLDGNRHSCGRA